MDKVAHLFLNKGSEISKEILKYIAENNAAISRIIIIKPHYIDKGKIDTEGMNLMSKYGIKNVPSLLYRGHVYIGASKIYRVISPTPAAPSPSEDETYAYQKKIFEEGDTEESSSGLTQDEISRKEMMFNARRGAREESAEVPRSGAAPRVREDPRRTRMMVDAPDDPEATGYEGDLRATSIEEYFGSIADNEKSARGLPLGRGRGTTPLKRR